MNASSARPSSTIDVQHRVEKRHIRVGIELEIVRGVPGQIAAARIGHDQLHSRLRGVLDERRGHRMIHRGVRADHENHFGIGDVAHLVRHRARVDAFHQRRHARCMAQARAVVDVVGAEAGAHQFLEQVRLFVGAFGGAETGQRPLAVRIANLTESLGRDIQRFFPGGLAENLAASCRDRPRSPWSSGRPACGSAAW